MEKITNGNHQELRFDSLEDFIDGAKRGKEAAFKLSEYKAQRSLGPDKNKFAGGSMEDAYRLAEEGWVEGLTEAMPIAESALNLVETEIESIQMDPAWDVTGTEVDIGRYVQGIPENMVDYALTPVSNEGRVITLCASSCYSGSLSKEAVMKRGAAITALALALERTGHETELWADITVGPTSRVRSGKKATLRVLVKGVNDVVDPERIAYAFAHPTFLRRLGFASMWLLDEAWRKDMNVGGGYGRPTNPVEDLEDGTIYLPAVLTDRNIPDADKFITRTLEGLGLMA